MFVGIGYYASAILYITSSSCKASHKLLSPVILELSGRFLHVRVYKLVLPEGMLTNFCTDGTPNSQTPHKIEFEGVKRPTTGNSTPPLFHGHLNKFSAACHVFESGEVTIAWYKMAKEDRDNAFIHPYFGLNKVVRRSSSLKMLITPYLIGSKQIQV
ncbi:uncharacterized protein [Malus domestica]|uniref:uncharacterized protein isoform X2 n=1 Tax=Malus domestica TaxID=3750 RepID=UPI0039764007